jgi:hypothetical protein
MASALRCMHCRSEFNAHMHVVRAYHMSDIGVTVSDTCRTRRAATEVHHAVSDDAIVTMWCGQRTIQA